MSMSVPIFASAIGIGLYVNSLMDISSFGILLTLCCLYAFIDCIQVDLNKKGEGR